MNRLKDLIYDMILFLARLGWRKPAPSPKLLIVRVDEIGDYILWRPFLKEIAKQYSTYEIHFCGNTSWQSLFNTFDAAPFTKTYWINKHRFKKNMGYRHHLLRSLYQENYAVVINPTFSRDKRYDDSIVRAVKSKKRIGMVSNKETVRKYELSYDKTLYTSLFDYPEKPIFEFIRNRLFTEFLTGKASGSKDTSVDTSLLPILNSKLPDNYFVLFPGSRSATRIWPTDHFVVVADYLYKQYGWTAILAGTHNDRPYVDAFCNKYPHPIVNMTGKTNLTEMLSLLTKAKCLLSVDTGSVHLAACVACPVFGIFNGSQFKRFAPYPKELSTSFFPIYPDTIEKDLQNPSIVQQKYEFVVTIPYSSVQPEKVIIAIHQYFS